MQTQEVYHIINAFLEKRGLPITLVRVGRLPISKGNKITVYLAGPCISVRRFPKRYWRFVRTLENEVGPLNWQRSFYGKQRGRNVKGQ